MGSTTVYQAKTENAMVSDVKKVPQYYRLRRKLVYKAKTKSTMIY